MSTSYVFTAQSAHEDELLAKRNVVGVAVGYKNEADEAAGEVALVVLVEQKLPAAALTPEDLVPRQINGVKTDVIEVGYLRANQVSPGARERHRPTIPAGVSIGHFKVTAGTYGALVRDRASGQPFILSNNHVLANSNDATPGEPILQPAAMDGGKQPGDIVAVLERFIPLKYIGDPVSTTPTNPNPNPNPQPNPNPGPSQPSGLAAILIALVNLILRLFGSGQQATVTSSQAAAQAASAVVPVMPDAQTTSPENRVDAALARPVDATAFSGAIQQIGAISGTKPVALGMRIRKYGRTTDYTEGKVTLINATVNVGYNTAAGPKQARFTGQVICEPMSKGGDSGSLVVDADSQNAVGLLFAGSDLATIFSPIDAVLDALNVKF